MKEATVEETKVPSFPTYGATVGGKCRNEAGRWRGSCLCCWIPMHGSRSSSSLYHVLCLGGCTFSKSVCEPWVCVRCLCQLKCPQPWAQRQQLRPIHFPDELSPAGGEVTSPKVIYGIVDFSFLHFQLFATYTREHTPSHIAIHCTPSSIRLLFLETFYSCFIAFIPQIALIFTHIDEAIHLSGTRKWLEWDMSHLKRDVILQHSEQTSQECEEFLWGVPMSESSPGTVFKTNELLFNSGLNEIIKCVWSLASWSLAVFSHLFFWFSLCGCSVGTQTKTALVIMIEAGSLGKHLYTLTVPKNVHLHTRQHTWKNMAAHSFTLARTHTMHK